MTISEYLEGVKDRLLTDACVSRFTIRRERATLSEGYLRVRLVLVNDDELEFSEYVRIGSADEIEVVIYSYHWSTADGMLVCRWDNTPHFPHLTGFPHHVHRGEGDAEPGQPVTFLSVLDAIVQTIKDSNR